MRPNDRLIELVDVAESGREDVSLSSSEAIRVHQLRRTLGAFERGVYEASSEAIERAKLVFEPKPNVFWARLTRSTLGLAGARSAAPSAFQAMFECEAGSARIEYIPNRNGWTVRGKCDATSGSVEMGLESKTLVDGRFEFQIANLDEAEITVLSGAAMWTIPPIVEGLSDDNAPGA